MKRSVGVMVAAGVLLLYAIALLAGFVNLVSLAFRLHPGENMRVVRAMTLPVLRILVIGFGFFATSWGIFRLRRWARWSILCIATGMVGSGAYIWIDIYLTLPNHGRTGGPSLFDSPLGLALIGMLFLIVPGTWWLILFTRPSVEALFADSPRSFPETTASSEDASAPQ
ncbi:MAG TPA: hypothetical protein VGR81_00540 [Candidatus Acidoferrales bacterium]|nr:hypothetical protein [Candidatus Acidoferrales bacterium]